MWRLAPVDVGEIVQGVVQQFEPQFDHQRFEVTVRIAPGLPEVMADAEAVELAVGNLLSNAMKYSGDARRIEVDLTREGGHLLVRVVDHGIGIPRRMQSRIFEKFFRIEDSAEGPRGCGLGLAIVDQVMRAHGGRVTVDSEPGRGSTFTLRFPIPKERPASDEADSRNRRRAPDAAGAA
jgi:two-component system phosphate regulon sensor histidine kinase PhoR